LVLKAWHRFVHRSATTKGESTVNDINFDDLDLAAIDLGTIEIASASDTTAAPAHGASSLSWGLCSCSCSYVDREPKG
jgi:hypothetical protein